MWMLIALFGVLLVMGMTSWNMADEPEPNVAIASRWWPDFPKLVTPVGWRDHPHRINVVYDGTTFALPAPGQHLSRPPGTPQWRQGVQLTFTPSHDGTIIPPRHDEHQLSMPDGSEMGDQGWTADAAPVLWTRWKLHDGPMRGIELRYLVFAHMLGGGEPQTGEEPMFGRIRLEVTRRDASADAQVCGFLIRLNAPHIRFRMLEHENAIVLPQLSTYPGALRLEPIGAAANTAGLLIEEDGRVRLAVVPGAARTLRFTPRPEEGRDCYLFISMPAIQGSHVDLILPIVPADRATLDEELAMTWEAALDQANRFWTGRPPTAATVHTPEPLINKAIVNSKRLARMISVTIPGTHQKSLLSGSMIYAKLWITPTSMVSHMLLDPLGWHGEVEKYLEIHRLHQGEVKPPGDIFLQHHGYFGVPREVDAGYQWLTDHGAVMYTAARHAMLTGDQRFIEKWTPALLKGYEFIRDARRLPRNPPQVQGIMPAASASDKKDPLQSFWSDGWNYKGLAETARVLDLCNHPRAAEVQREADEYRAAIVAALRSKAARMPKWKDRCGRDRTIVPMALSADDSNGYGIEHPFYLDTGPMFGVYASLLPADDTLMQDAADFFRGGPHTADPDATFLWTRTARLIHEMSSAEPCYSWNVFHTHQLGDRQRFLEGMYSLFTGAMSRQTFVSCETRDGITATVFANPLACYLARLAVIDDELERGKLHLLRLVPLAWLSDSQQTVFQNMPTEFGPVTLKWMLRDAGRTLDLTCTTRFRRRPDAVVLHAPPLPHLEKVVINNESGSARAGQQFLLRPQSLGS